MQELRGDLFKPGTYVPSIGMPDAICITTNGFVKRNGECVMGKGCAKQAAVKYPGLTKDLGTAIRANGNVVQILRTAVLENGHIIHLVAFPVKGVGMDLMPHVYYNEKEPWQDKVVKHMHDKFSNGDRVPGWALKADPFIISRSCRELTALADERGWTTVVLPRPGCGAGELKWDNVIKPLISVHLDDMYYCITYR